MKNIILKFFFVYSFLSCEQEVDPKLLPVVCTSIINSVSYNSARSGGFITADGGYDVVARGVCWSVSPNPTIGNSKTVDAAGTGEFVSSIDSLTPNTTYFVRAYATNKKGTAYGLQETFTTMQLALPQLTTTALSELTTTFATCGGFITHDGGAAISARGVCWSAEQNPTIDKSISNNGTGVGEFASSITGLKSGTTYYVRAYATNSVGTAYGNELIFNALNSGEVYSPKTGKVWMDRNLGAGRVATSSTDAEAYGNLYQWGRATDGHEKRTSQNIYLLSSNDTPGHGMFISVSSGGNDWRSTQNNSLWQGVDGVNNPCPEGFRLPTLAEWNAERNSWSHINSAGAFASPLKLPVAGYRFYNNGLFSSVGSSGYYWSGTVNGADAHLLIFNIYFASIGSYGRAYGYSVRCIKN